MLDGAAVWRLVREQRSLDLNAGYAYLLLCTRFSSTCRVARVAASDAQRELRDDGLVAALMGLRLPERPDTLFVWQIVVHERHRSQGLARALIEHVLRKQSSADIRYLEAHVSPDNGASEAMFRGLARALDANVQVSPELLSEHYPTEHGPENLLRIGPFDLGPARNAQTLTPHR